MTGTSDEIFILSVLLIWTAEILSVGMFSNRLLFSRRVALLLECEKGVL